MATLIVALGAPSTGAEAACLDGVQDVVSPTIQGHFRSEGNFVDSSAAGIPVTAIGGPAYSTDVPVATVPHAGAANTRSLQFDGVDDELVMDSLFPFHGGPPPCVKARSW